MRILRRVFVSLTIVCVGSLLFYEPAKRFPGYFFGAAIVLLVVAVVFAQFRKQPDYSRGWRVGHIGRDAMYYEDWRDGVWQRFEIAGEMRDLRVSEAHHAISFASTRFPEWASERRDEIVSRIKSEFRPPDYEYVDA